METKYTEIKGVDLLQIANILVARYKKAGLFPSDKKVTEQDLLFVYESLTGVIPNTYCPMYALQDATNKLKGIS